MTVQVKVLDLVGNVIAFVSKQSTSVGVSKRVGMPVRREKRKGEWVWECYTPRWCTTSGRDR
jgi:hypothetical protein